MCTTPIRSWLLANTCIAREGEDDPIAVEVDELGNWVRKAVPLADGANTIEVEVLDKYTRTFDDSRHVTRTAAPTYAYDENGNITSDGRWTYTWNDENRLVAAVPTTPAVNDQKVESTYDGLGRRRVKKTYTWNGSQWTLTKELRFVYDGNNLVAELDGSDAVLRKYLWGPDLSGTMDGAAGVGGLLAVSDGTNTRFPAYDGNGNVTAYMDAADAVVSTAEYDPFGKIIASTGTAPCAFGFSTVYRDSETGLLAYRFRFYDPATGRWPSRDPIGEMGGYNLYAMVGNDAVGRVDLWGFESIRDWTMENIKKKLGTNLNWDPIFERYYVNQDKFYEILPAEYTNLPNSRKVYDLGCIGMSCLFSKDTSGYTYTGRGLFSGPKEGIKPPLDFQRCYWNEPDAILATKKVVCPTGKCPDIIAVRFYDRNKTKHNEVDEEADGRIPNAAERYWHGGDSSFSFDYGYRTNSGVYIHAVGAGLNIVISPSWREFQSKDLDIGSDQRAERDALRASDWNTTMYCIKCNPIK